MSTICKPSVNRLQKMVPEGGFEPPTRGFSINVQPQFSALEIVNQPQNGLFGINSLQTGCKPKRACEHTRVKGNPHRNRT